MKNKETFKMGSFEETNFSKKDVSNINNPIKEKPYKYYQDSLFKMLMSEEKY